MWEFDEFWWSGGWNDRFVCVFGDWFSHKSNVKIYVFSLISLIFTTRISSCWFVHNVCNFTKLMKINCFYVFCKKVTKLCATDESCNFAWIFWLRISLIFDRISLIFEHVWLPQRIITTRMSSCSIAQNSHFAVSDGHFRVSDSDSGFWQILEFTCVLTIFHKNYKFHNFTHFAQTANFSVLISVLFLHVPLWKLMIMTRMSSSLFTTCGYFHWFYSKKHIKITCLWKVTRNA